MEYGISLLSVIPIRKEPDERSEMVTQILFGEYYTIMEHSKNWLNIQTELDHYTGWIDTKMATVISEKTFLIWTAIWLIFVPVLNIS